MPSISQSPKAIFHILKKRVTSEFGHDVDHVNFGNHRSVTVVKDFDAQVPGSMVGQEREHTVTIQASSIVDDRPETNDSVYFSFNNKDYFCSESRYTGSESGTGQAYYGLQIFDGTDWKSIEGLPR